MSKIALNRWRIFNDGPGRWVLSDTESDDPASVFKTQEAAEAAMLAAGLEAMGFEDKGVSFDPEIGPTRMFSLKL